MTASSPRLSVVIPAYNRRDSVLTLLADLHRQVHDAFEIIVVDDQSPDDTYAAIQNQFPGVVLLRNERNSGPAVSRNNGIRAARGSIIVGFDSDVTVPDPLVLQKVEATFAAHPATTGLAFRLLTPDGTAEDKPRWWHPVPIDRYFDRPFETDYFSGTGYAFRRQEMIEAGLFPEILYMHYEEVELAYRILDAGGSIRYCPEISVRHHAHPVSTRSKIKVFYKPRNQILMAIACFPWLRGGAYLFPRLTYHFLQAVRHGHLSEFWSALRSARELGSIRMRTRAPLRRGTWRTIAQLRR